MKGWNERKRDMRGRSQIARDMYVGFLLVNNANDDKYSDLKYELNQAYLTGTNNFPMSADEDLQLIINHEPRRGRNTNRSRISNSGGWQRYFSWW